MSLGLDPTPPAAAVPFSSTIPGKEDPSPSEVCAPLVSMVFICAVVGGIIYFSVWLVLSMEPHCPRYSVAIDSFSGVATNRTDLALDPEFNLTLRVTTSRRHGDAACVQPGTYLVVAYRCITLATSATAQHRLCAAAAGGRPGKAAEQRLVARGTGVRVPGTVLDSLAADVRQGGPAFQVAVRWSGGRYDGDVLVAACGGRRVGGGPDDLGASCDAWPLCP